MPLPNLCQRERERKSLIAADIRCPESQEAKDWKPKQVKHGKAAI